MSINDRPKIHIHNGTGLYCGAEQTHPNVKHKVALDPYIATCGSCNRLFYLHKNSYVNGSVGGDKSRVKRRMEKQAEFQKDIQPEYEFI